MFKRSKLQRPIENVEINEAYNEMYHKDLKLPLPFKGLAAILTGILSVFIITIYIESILPPPLKINDVDRYSHQFIAERAMKSLEKLTSIGPRVTGSYANEVLAVKFLRDEVEEIRRTANRRYNIEVDAFRASGAFPLSFLDGMSQVYEDIFSLVVKVNSGLNSSHSLLINCHFDTVSDSPGASDDGAGCAVMLELMRVITRSNQLIKHNIIFLFNGGEENIMQASHGFITQHKWAKEIGAFVNLEACGAGGREILFQAGPNNPWILETYSQSVPYPFASSLAQEVFESGLIPADTDYRIFRDFGNASGVDFAWSQNGYVYHTARDTVEQMPLGSLQRTGDNILAMVLAMVNGHQLSDMQAHRSGNLVFFDFLGAFVIRWTEVTSIFINLFIIVITISWLYFSVKVNGTNRSVLVRCCFSLFVNIGASLATTVGIALLMNVVDRTMAWYTNTYWLLPIYIIPALGASMFSTVTMSKKIFKGAYSPWTMFRVHNDANILFWTLVLIVCVLARLRSGFLPLVCLVFPLLGNILRQFYFKRLGDIGQIIYHLTVIILPFTQCFYLIYEALGFFVPIFGRSGAGNNSEIILAAIVGLFFNLLFGFITPLVLLVQKPKLAYKLFAGIFFAAFFVIVFTPLGFPYSESREKPTQQRYIVINSNLKYLDESGNVRKEDSGFWIVNMDINSPHSVKHLIPEFEQAREITSQDCLKELYCGMPYFLPVLHFIFKTHWIPTAPLSIPLNTTLKVLEKKYESSKSVKVTLQVEGPDHISVVVSPLPHVKLIKWSLYDDPPLAGPDWNGRKTYFIYYAYANVSKPLNVTLHFEVDDAIQTSRLMDVATIGSFFHGKNQVGTHLREFMAKFPPWTVLNTWTSQYISYKL